MNRYRLNRNGRMEPSDDGGWVPYEETATLRAENKELRAMANIDHWEGISEGLQEFYGDEYEKLRPKLEQK